MHVAGYAELGRLNAHNGATARRSHISISRPAYTVVDGATSGHTASPLDETDSTRPEEDARGCARVGEISRRGMRRRQLAGENAARSESRLLIC